MHVGENILAGVTKEWKWSVWKYVKIWHPEMILKSVVGILSSWIHLSDSTWAGLNLFTINVKLNCFLYREERCHIRYMLHSDVSSLTCISNKIVTGTAKWTEKSKLE